MTTDYTPIACDAYDAVEILAMRRSKVKILTSKDQHLQGKVINTSIHDGAEYLVLETKTGEREVRLDQIKQIINQNNQLLILQKDE